jgi:hypothetical protein
MLVAELTPGDFFGEVALLQNNGGVRHATVMAGTQCKLMSLGRRDFAAINRRQPDFISQMLKEKKNVYSDMLETTFGREASKFLNRVPCLAELDSIDQRKLLETAICHVKIPGETIFEAGSIVIVVLHAVSNWVGLHVPLRSLHSSAVFACFVFWFVKRSAKRFLLVSTMQAIRARVCTSSLKARWR